jgi:hypothetical protein
VKKSNRIRHEAKPQTEPTQDDVDERATERAGKVLYEFAADAIANDARGTDGMPVTERIIRLIARWIIRDHIIFGPDRGRFVDRALGLDTGTCLSMKGIAQAEAKLNRMGEKDVLALGLRLCAEVEIFEAPRGPFAGELLDWPERDWDQLQEQAVYELTGRRPADTSAPKGKPALGPIRADQPSLFDGEESDSCASGS